MKAKSENAIKFPKIVERAEWQTARDALLVKEKTATRAKDALASERRRLPMVRIDKKYIFDGAKGEMSLLDLFEGRRQLILYHFMFAPPVGGWPDAGCVGCSMVTDQFGHVAHLHARDTSFCLVSLAPLKNIEKYKKRMGWMYPWYSSEGTDFNKDFGLTTDKGENFGLSVFIHDGKDVYRTYHTGGRGTEGLNIGTLLDLTPLGRQEEWEDSPAGGPRTKPFVWWRRHDEYGKDSGGER
ncbi:MAG: DUF899 domain-containing protein [Planctomycetota bacterium]|nr:DUF899 domain-containing protein [Planctomycetota bacterium]